MRLSRFSSQNHRTVLDTKGSIWSSTDFLEYDTVFHVAEIAHSDVGDMTSDESELYYKVNRDLTAETAFRAKRRVFCSLLSGMTVVLRDDLGIQRNWYSKYETDIGKLLWQLKLEAEKKLEKLQAFDFKFVLGQAIMIERKGSSGNYLRMSKYGEVVVFSVSKKSTQYERHPAFSIVLNTKRYHCSAHLVLQGYKQQEANRQSARNNCAGSPKNLLAEKHL